MYWDVRETVLHAFSTTYSGTQQSTDKVGPESLSSASHTVYGALDQTPNHVKFFKTLFTSF
jgi:hypothetical protein